MRILPPSFTPSRIAKLHTHLSPSMTIHHHNIISKHHHHHHHQDSIVVIMGATGTGKTKLSIDVATRYESEIINSDKIQVYRGLDITTNKIPLSDRRRIPHHVIGTVDPAGGELSASSFRSLAAAAVNSIASRRKIPVIAGGSNSFIHAMVSDSYDPKLNPFKEPISESRHRHQLRYRCCFIWVDVERSALREYLDRRVDEMVGSGMVEELEGYFSNKTHKWERNVGLNKAIGVPEFWGHFGKRVTCADAVKAIKENTWRLAEEQVRKIRRLGELGWDLQRVDATEVVKARLCGAHKELEEGRWEMDVMGPTFGSVEKFLEDEEEQEDDRRLIMPLLPAPSASSCCY